MASGNYMRRRARVASERGRRMGRASERARERRAAVSNEPVREVRGIEITIRDSHRPMTVIRVRQHQGDEGEWGRLRVEGMRMRPVGRAGLGRLVAAAVL